MRVSDLFFAVRQMLYNKPVTLSDNGLCFLGQGACLGTVDRHSDSSYTPLIRAEGMLSSSRYQTHVVAKNRALIALFLWNFTAPNLR